VAAIGPQILASSAVSVEAPKLESKTPCKIIGGNPGTDECTLVFKEAHVKGLATCLVKSPTGAAGEIIVPVKTLLGYAVAETIPTAYEQFFPAEAGNIFVTLEFPGSTCGALKGTKIKVNATGGTAPKAVGFGERNCGVIGEVGKIKAGVFELAKDGELFKVGGLRLPTTAITEEKVWNSETKTFVAVKCSLTAAGTAATQSGTASIELEGMEEFGVES
jgi:hypothetical protein